MATTGAFNATKFRFIIGSNTFVNEKGCTLRIEGDKIPTTSKDSEGWDEFIGGLKRWSGSGTAIFAFTPGTGKTGAIEMIDEFMTGDRLASAKFTTGTTGEKEITGTIFMDNIEIKAEMETAMEVSFSFTGSGKPALATV